ncbi:unnamed protein product [Gadus morhua 'NCC']
MKLPAPNFEVARVANVAEIVFFGKQSFFPCEAEVLLPKVTPRALVDGSPLNSQRGCRSEHGVEQGQRGTAQQIRSLQSGSRKRNHMDGVSGAEVQEMKSIYSLIPAVELVLLQPAQLSIHDSQGHSGYHDDDDPQPPGRSEVPGMRATRLPLIFPRPPGGECGPSLRSKRTRAGGKAEGGFSVRQKAFS